MDDLRERLAACFATVFPDLAPEEIPQAAMASVGAWDSLATVTLLTLIEEEFALQVPPGELAELTSFELILDYLQREAAHVS
jgi:acyl carrier protein